MIEAVSIALAAPGASWTTMVLCAQESHPVYGVGSSAASSAEAPMRRTAAPTTRPRSNEPVSLPDGNASARAVNATKAVPEKT